MMKDGTKGALVNAVRAILRPLVRQLIARGLTYPAFGRIAKEVYIDVATRHFALPFKKQTDSRVALVTGITRKEIGQIRRGQTPPPSETAQLSYGRATLVMSHWVTDRRYLQPDKSPRELPYEDSGKEASFSGLVSEVGGDIPVRAVLDELIHLGAVELLANGAVRLLQRGYAPARGAEEKLAILGTDVAELISAIAHNLEHPPDEAFLQRKVYYDNVGASALAQLRQKVRTIGGEFTERINTLLASYDRDRNPAAPGGNRKRVVVAVHYLEEDYAPPDSDGEEATGSKQQRRR